MLGRGWAWCRRHPRVSAATALICAVLAIIGRVGGVGSTAENSSPARTTTAPASAAAPSGPWPHESAGATGAASVLLDTVAIKGRAPKTGYDRAQFGAAWTDDNDVPMGHNGCDTRNDVLRRDLVDVTLTPGSFGCAVLSGVLPDPYTGATIRFERGVGTSEYVQIDHVVAFGDAWQTGAQQWSAGTRVDFANDPLNLLAVDGSTNESKGDADAASWLPPNKAYRCSYVARQVAVKARYGLWTTRAEHDAIARVLSTCPGRSVPSEPRVATRPGATPTTPKTSTPTSTTSTHGAPTTSTYFPDCAAARAAGAAPLRRGRPGYRPELDGDGDGIACEG